MDLDYFLAMHCAEPLSCRGDNASTDAEVGARIREELVLAERFGALPAGTRCSVRVGKGSYSGGSIAVEITGWTGAVFSDEHLAHLLDPKGTPMPHHSERLAPALSEALRRVDIIADRHNFDDSRSMEDYYRYGYNLGVTAGTLEYTAAHGIKVESDPEFRHLVERARAASAVIGKRAAKSLLGRYGISGTSKHGLETVIRYAERYGCELAYDRRRGIWLPSIFGKAREGAA